MEFTAWHVELPNLKECQGSRKLYVAGNYHRIGCVMLMRIMQPIAALLCVWSKKHWVMPTLLQLGAIFMRDQLIVLVYT